MPVMTYPYTMTSLDFDSLMQMPESLHKRKIAGEMAACAKEIDAITVMIATLQEQAQKLEQERKSLEHDYVPPRKGIEPQHVVEAYARILAELALLAQELKEILKIYNQLRNRFETLKEFNPASWHQYPKIEEAKEEFKTALVTLLPKDYEIPAELEQKFEEHFDIALQVKNFEKTEAIHLASEAKAQSNPSQAQKDIPDAFQRKLKFAAMCEFKMRPQLSKLKEDLRNKYPHKPENEFDAAVKDLSAPLMKSIKFIILEKESFQQQKMEESMQVSLAAKNVKQLAENVLERHKYMQNCLPGLMAQLNRSFVENCAEEDKSELDSAFSFITRPSF